jgi:hypothetical protein
MGRCRVGVRVRGRVAKRVFRGDDFSQEVFLRFCEIVKSLSFCKLDGIK